MKKIYMCLLGLGLLSLLLFYLFGNTLYAWGKPVITTVRASSVAGKEGVFVPLDALCSDSEGDYVYVLLSEMGYSHTIYSVSRVSAEVVFEDESTSTAILTDNGNIKIGDRIVIGDVDHLSDGVRVIVSNQH